MGMGGGRCGRLEHVDVSGCTQLGDAVLKVIAARLESLRELNISFLEVIMLLLPQCTVPRPNHP